VAKILNAPKKDENDHNEESKTYASRRDIAPLPTVRPARQSADECQNQKDNQDSSKHLCAPFQVSGRYSAALAQRQS
jgi:hypothetical protein